MGLCVIGVPFNSAGRDDGVARAPAALRRAGLVQRLAGRVEARDAGDVDAGVPRPERSRRSGLLTEDALITMTGSVRAAVAAAHADGDVPLVVGGDCPVLLGGLAATRDRFGSVGLVMVDGHEDAYPPHQSLSGEAADSELYLALGLPSAGLPEALRELMPLLEPRQVALLGPRDATVLAREGVPSLRGTVAMHTDVELIDRGAGEVARRAAEDVRTTAAAWWLHVDLDALATEQLSAVDYPQAGGLTWDQLAEVTAAALATPGCAGWTVTIFNPDLDPDRQQAGRIVEYIAGVAEHVRALPGEGSAGR